MASFQKGNIFDLLRDEGDAATQAEETSEVKRKPLKPVIAEKPKAVPEVKSAPAKKPEPTKVAEARSNEPDTSTPERVSARPPPRPRALPPPRPGKREFERHSGTGRGKEVAKDGHGGWGTNADEKRELEKPTQPEPSEDETVEASPVPAEKPAEGAEAAAAAPVKKDKAELSVTEYLKWKESQLIKVELPPPTREEGDWKESELLVREEDDSYKITKPKEKKTKIPTPAPAVVKGKKKGGAAPPPPPPVAAPAKPKATVVAHMTLSDFIAHTPEGDKLVRQVENERRARQQAMRGEAPGAPAPAVVPQRRPRAPAAPRPAPVRSVAPLTEEAFPTLHGSAAPRMPAAPEVPASVAPAPVAAAAPVAPAVPAPAPQQS